MPIPSSRAPLQPPPIPEECWQSVSMDFVFGFPEDAHKNNGIFVFVGRFSKMVHLAAVNESICAHGCALVFINTGFRLHGLPRELVSDRDPRFTATFEQSVFRSLGARLATSTSDHPETNVQTEPVIASSKRYFEDTSNLSEFGANFCRWWGLQSTSPCMHRQRIHHFS